MSPTLKKRSPGPYGLNGDFEQTFNLVIVILIQRKKGKNALKLFVYADLFPNQIKTSHKRENYGLVSLMNINANVLNKNAFKPNSRI